MSKADATVAVSETKVPPALRTNLLVIVLGASDFPKHPSFHKETEKNAAFGRSCAAVRDLFLQLGVPDENICDLCDLSANPKEILDLSYDFILRRCTAANQQIEDVLFYYVGHGLGAKEQYSLLLHDSDPANISETSLRFSSLVARIKRAADKVRRHRLRQFYLIDACLAGRTKYAADIISGAKQPPTPAGHHPATGIVVLASCNDNEASFTLPGHTYTLFTHALLAAATWPDSDRDHLRARYANQDLSLSNLREIMNRWLAIHAALEESPPTVLTISLDTSAGDIQDVPILPNPLTANRRMRPLPPPQRRSRAGRRWALIAVGVALLLFGVVAYKPDFAHKAPLDWQITPEPLFADPSQVHPLVRKIPDERRVQYVRDGSHDSTVIRCQLPYLEAVRSGKRVAGADLSISPFAWEFPQLCFLLNNQSSHNVVVSGAKFTVANVEVETRPLLVVQEGALERLHFLNAGQGTIEDPVLHFTIVDVDDKSAPAEYAQHATLSSFEDEHVFSLSDFISKEITTPEIRVYGEVDYRHAGQPQKFVFTTLVTLELPGQAAVPISAEYKIRFHAEPGETQWAEAKHLLSPVNTSAAVDRFLIRIASTRPATYYFEVELHTDAGILKQPLQLEVFVPRSGRSSATPSLTPE